MGAGDAGALRQVFAEPAPLMAGAGPAGDPVATLPVLFHLLWRVSWSRICRCRWDAHAWCGLTGGGLTARMAAVLRPGDRVRYDGVRSCRRGGRDVGTAAQRRPAPLVVLASPDGRPEFAVTGGGPMPEVEPSGLLESLPEGVLGKARELERHVVEVQTGLLPDAAPGSGAAGGLRPGRPDAGARDRAKAAELGVTCGHAVAAGTLCPAGPVGPGGSAGGPASAATGRADARLVAVIRDLVAAETTLRPGRGRG